ncbi:MAG: hypothetical protein WKH64_02760 [Chloroflexia bacterium]
MVLGFLPDLASGIVSAGVYLPGRPPPGRSAPPPVDVWATAPQPGLH